MQVCDDPKDCYREKDGGKYKYNSKGDGDDNGKKKASSNVGWSSARGVYACGACVFVMHAVCVCVCVCVLKDCD